MKTKTKAKKLVYMFGAVTLAVVVFMISLFFKGDKGTGIAPSFENSSTSQSSEQLEQDSSGAGLGGGGGSEGGGGGGSSGGGGKPILFTVLTDKSQRLYLRQDGKGDYTGKGEHGFVGDHVYYLENKTDVNPLYYLGLTMQNSNGQQAHQAEIELINIVNDLIPYAPIGKTNAERETENKTYTVTYYPYHYFSNDWESLTPMRQNAAYTEQEQRYYDFVKETYLTIPSTLKQTLLDLAAENDIVANSSTVISDVVYYIRNAAMYDYFYADKNYPNDKDMVTHFLTGIRRGVCRHFAAAATMMFRALGIPARYTIGFAVDVEANVKLEYRGDGHAWTEIYLQGYGWIPLEVTGSNLYTGEA